MSARRAVVFVVSTRAATGVYEDTTGPLLLEWLREREWRSDLVVVADGDPLREALEWELTSRPELVITSGGTGISPTDRTPEITRELIDLEIPGFAEELRRRSAPAFPTAILSRGVAGVSGTTVVVNLPGSTGGVRDGLALLDDVLEHMLSQVGGGDHAR